MPLVVLPIVALAAVLHVVWNVILKTAGDPLRTSARAMVAGVALWAPVGVAAYLWAGRPEIPVAAWGLAFLSGVLETAYFVCLGAAYRRGDLSLVYPIARGTAPVLTVVAGVVVLGERLPPVGLAGVGVILVGLLLLQRPWQVVAALTRPRVAAGRASSLAVVGLALATGVTIAAYSAVDRVGARVVAPWLFAALVFPICALGTALWVRFVDRWPRATDGSDAPWRRSTLAGVMTIGAYLLILFAYSVAPLSIVSPLRESAVVLAAGWGSLRLGEAAAPREAATRIGAASLVLVGAVLVAVGR